MAKDVLRPGVRKGYDLWSSTYDQTPNPLVHLDRRFTFDVLAPEPGEVILDAGCGTGYYPARIHDAGARCIGADISFGMLTRTRSILPHISLVQTNLDGEFPYRSGSFHAVLSSLVSEHIANLGRFCGEVFRVLRPGGRFIWSVFHPALAHTGTEANFVDQEGYEVRLGAELHTTDDYRTALGSAGLIVDRWEEVKGDASLARVIPRAEKYVGKPMLIIVRAHT